MRELQVYVIACVKYIYVYLLPSTLYIHQLFRISVYRMPNKNGFIYIVIKNKFDIEQKLLIP